MNWGYTNNPQENTAENAVGVHGEAKDNTMGPSMFANDGMSENNQTVQRLLKEGYEPQALEDALKSVQNAIQNGLPVSRMPATSVLPSGVLEDLYDEAAIQTGAPTSAQLEAQLAEQQQLLVSTMKDNERSGGAVGSAVSGSFALISPSSLNDIRNLTKNPDLQMTIAEEGAKICKHCEFDGKHHSAGLLGDLGVQNVGTQQREQGAGVGFA